MATKYDTSLSNEAQTPEMIAYATQKATLEQTISNLQANGFTGPTVQNLQNELAKLQPPPPINPLKDHASATQHRMTLEQNHGNTC